MLGAIIGDIVGSVYEFDNIKTKSFPLFASYKSYTDDSILAIATADWLLHGGNPEDYYFKYAIKYDQPMGGYGSRFWDWVEEGKSGKRLVPYYSCGNGSAMRVSSAGWLYDTIEDTRRVARLTAEITHNHPEGIKGAEAVASAIFLARTGHNKQEIKDYITNEFGYDLSRTCDTIRPTYKFNETCQETVPEAIIAFLEGTDFEDVIRNAVSLGGDCDTLTCIAGSIAEAFYSVPNKFKIECLNRIKDNMKQVIMDFLEVKK